MTVGYSHTFKKMFRRQTAPVQVKFGERLSLFIENTHHPLLNNHSLNGEWAGCRSINITGDIRAVFEKVTKGHSEFVAIGSHNELYS